MEALILPNIYITKSLDNILTPMRYVMTIIVPLALFLISAAPSFFDVGVDITITTHI